MTVERKRTFSEEWLREIGARLEQAHKAFQKRYPGASAGRQPVHVVYGGAHLFRSGIARRLGDLAQRSLDEYAPDFIAFAKAIGLPGASQLPDSPGSAAESLAHSVELDPAGARRERPAAWLAHTVYARVREKLRKEPVEDFRIDFEDGYGNRPDSEEDQHAVAAAAELSAGMSAGELPPFIGIRIKPLTEELRDRSIRTLDIFLTELAAKSHGELPPHFYITLPKVALPDEVAVLADLCARLEPALDLTPGALRIELMIETAQAVINERGEAAPLALVTSARGRCVAVHFGPYDYTANLQIAAPRESLTHPSAQFARSVMQASLAGTGVRLGDGPVNLLPIPPYRPAQPEASGTTTAPLTAHQREQNRATVHAAWKLHFDIVLQALAKGYYQGWDLHPAQLPTRYAAVYSFFLENLDSASARLKNFIEQAAQATRIGHVFDDAAMAQGLLSYFSQGIHSGALTAAEVEERTTLSPADLRTGSFLQILEKRRC
jgi:citrate lyase beta subunit